MQVIPHITDEIKSWIRPAPPTTREVAIVEVGGTVGDIESLPFLEAIRQMGITLGRENVCYIHLTLVPFIATAGEMKTKPTQHSVKELREIGIQPDVVLCRADRPLSATATGARSRCSPTSRPRRSSRRSTPIRSTRSRGAARRGPRRDRLQEARHRAAAGRPRDVGQARRRARASGARRCTSRMVGKYVDLTESYKSLSEALIARRHPHALQGAASTTSTRRRSSATASTRCAAWTRSSSPAASASAASRARSRRSATRARTAFRISASASACSSRSSSTRATRPGSPTRTAPSSIRTRRIRSSR